MTNALAVVVERPEQIQLRRLELTPRGPLDVAVRTCWSGISTGTERLLFSGRMPSFPGMGYPLVPGYETVGVVEEAPAESGLSAGQFVFVPGAQCFGPVRGLFGGAASHIVTPGARVAPDRREARRARRAARARSDRVPRALGASAEGGDLIVGHGVLGRLLARLSVAAGGAPPVVWENNPARVEGAQGYAVVDPEADPHRDYQTIYDVSGDATILDRLIARLRPGGEIVLAGFYDAQLAFTFPPAFMREARIRVAAQWRPTDLAAVNALVAAERLSFDGLITHRQSAREGLAAAYPDGLQRSFLPEDGARLEILRMSVNQSFLTAVELANPPVHLLRAEAAIEPDPVPAKATKETQIIAIYGKGGIGKSFTLANLSYMMAQQGKKVLLIGCDPKSDTTSLLFGGRACPTIIETSTKKKLAGEQVAIGDVCFKRDGVFAMELGGPEVGRGCGGRGIIHGFELLEKLGFHEWGFDYVLLDFLGDVVCGGFGLPIARDMCQKVIVVGSNDLQSLYVANNVCSAVEYFRKLGGNVGVGGLVINKDDGTGEAQAFAAAAGIPVLASIPADDDIRRKSANYEIIGRPAAAWALAVRAPRGQRRRCGQTAPSQAAHSGPVARPVQGRCGRAECRAGSRQFRGHVRNGGGPQAVARSRLRRRLMSRGEFMSKIETTAAIENRPVMAPTLDLEIARKSTPRRPSGRPGLPLGQRRCCAAAEGRRQERDLDPRATPKTTPRGRTTSRKACAPRSARCASAFGCGELRPSFAARHAASTA